jgi:hypothetical protein
VCGGSASSFGVIWDHGGYFLLSPAYAYLRVIVGRLRVSTWFGILVDCLYRAVVHAVRRLSHVWFFSGVVGFVGLGIRIII